MKKTSESLENDEKTIPIWDLGSPLYDSYELVSLSHHIDRHLMILPSLGGSRKRPSMKLCAASDASNNTHVRSSMVNALSEFVKQRLWRRKSKNGVGEKKVKAGTLLCGFHKMSGL
ncbi:hypothetical protein MANES_05G025400v8 [Manihot esculenta]|nr:hypothetical protein MANES_05G025400v8 [Manihot esculenta]